jgi:hypothetical protein
MSARRRLEWPSGERPTKNRNPRRCNSRRSANSGPVSDRGAFFNRCDASTDDAGGRDTRRSSFRKSGVGAQLGDGGRGALTKRIPGSPQFVTTVSEGHAPTTPNVES